MKDGAGETREANECLYFEEGILNTLVSLSALKNLGCMSKNFPYPDVETASSLMDRDNMDSKEDGRNLRSRPARTHLSDQNRSPFFQLK